MNAVETLVIHPAAQEVINRYRRIQVAPGRFLRCPYFRNPRSGRERWGLLVFSGKGSPQDLEDEIRIIEKLEGAHFALLADNEIYSILRKRKLGIDCSGFIAHALNVLALKERGRPLHKFLKFQAKGIGRIFAMVRPMSHLNIQTFILPENASRILDINDLLPGDLMVFEGPIDHAALIVKTSKQDAKLIGFEYAHAALEKGRGMVKDGSVDLIYSATSALCSQKWREEPNTGVLIYEGRGEPRFYRLRLFAKVDDKP